MALKLQHKDACIVTQYSRDELHAVLVAIQFEQAAPAQERVPQQYSRLDLIVLAAVSDLDKKFGLRRKVLAAIYRPLRNALSGPKSPNREARLLVTVAPPTVVYMDEMVPIEEGIVAPLKEVFDRVDGHLGAFEPVRSMGLKPTLVEAVQPPKIREKRARARSRPKKKSATRLGASR